MNKEVVRYRWQILAPSGTIRSGLIQPIKTIVREAICAHATLNTFAPTAATGGYCKKKIKNQNQFHFLRCLQKQPESRPTPHDSGTACLPQPKPGAHPETMRRGENPRRFLLRWRLRSRRIVCLREVPFHSSQNIYEVLRVVHDDGANETRVCPLYEVNIHRHDVQK